jgi:hypothetical protein
LPTPPLNEATVMITKLAYRQNNRMSRQSVLLVTPDVRANQASNVNCPLHVTALV